MILLIDTAQESGTTALCYGGTVLFSEENKTAKEHASWLHLAIGRILSQAGKTVSDLNAISVVAGPGSYTGIRVGMAAAKGFCFALKIPLITQNTLRVMAESMIPAAMEKNALICPMIDARRDEVFTALYKPNAERRTPNAEGLMPKNNLSTVNRQLSTLMEPRALILDKTSFEFELAGDSIIFFGSGAEKWKKIISSSNAIFLPQPNLIQAFAKLSQSDFDSGNWADPVYAEPVYLKEFFSY
jgi:tRNA threonylcarbamoyladenosine biosynthesis protein TsaB